MKNIKLSEITAYQYYNHRHSVTSDKIKISYQSNIDVIINIIK